MFKFNAPIESARQIIDILKEHLVTEDAYIAHMHAQHAATDERMNIERRAVFENNKWFGAKEFGEAAVGKPMDVKAPLLRFPSRKSA